VFINLFKLTLIAFVGAASAQAQNSNLPACSADPSASKHQCVGTGAWRNTDAKYFGSFANGLPDGRGVISWPDGDRYVGEVVNGVRHGLGTYFFNPSGPDAGRVLHGVWKVDGFAERMPLESAQLSSVGSETSRSANVKPSKPPLRVNVPSNDEPIKFADTAYQSKETESCLLQLTSDAKVKPLSGKLAFDLDKPQPLEMLANMTKATPKEKAALNFYSTEWQRCQELGADWRKRKLGPDIAALFSALQVDLSAGLADLYAGQITYGSAAKLRAKQWIEFKNGAEATERRHSAQTAENEKQRQIQMQRDAAAAQERAAQERSRQQAEANQRRTLELQQQQMAEQREMEAQRAAAFKKAESDREWDEAKRRRQEASKSTYRAPINCTTTTSMSGRSSDTTCY
jgi:hypothetical protein